MSTAHSHFDHLKTQLAKAGIEDPAYEARLILEEIAQMTWADIIARTPCTLNPQQTQDISRIVQERKTGKPLSRVFGKRDFYGLTFVLNSATLDPRPETEILIDHVLRFVEGTGLTQPRILDLGTGTGCIPITLLNEIPDATALAIDIAPEALKAGEANAKTHGVTGRFQTKLSNWFDAIEGQFDIITANPPYVDSYDCANLPETVRAYDPILALDGGEKGLAPYESLFANIKNYLKPYGRAFLEIGYGQCGYIERLTENYGIRLWDIHPDYAGIPRVVEISCGDK